MDGRDGDGAGTGTSSGVDNGVSRGEVFANDGDLQCDTHTTSARRRCTIDRS